ncbi:hypothetical protein [Georgenia deserti]|uniref:HTTM domain-containing protein n=1 Tax=Georgenia deserti TaxID=2093781 RepID=A0ABW4L564_9MICO
MRRRTRPRAWAAAAARRLFEAAPPQRLAGSRIVLGAYTLAYLLPRRRMFATVHRTDPALFAPVGPVRVLRRPLPAPVADGLVLAELAAATAFTVGLCHRVTGPAHAALLLWTVSYRNSWSMIFHSDNTTVLHTVIAGVSPSADAWSVDALVRGRRGARTPAPHWCYGYPAHVASGVTAVTYWLAGMAKVTGPLGWRWGTGAALRSQVAADALRKEVLGSSAAPLGKALYGHRTPWALAAGPSLAIELGAPVALLHPRLARLWAISALGMHWGIKALMDITFRYQLSGVAYASLVPWEELDRLSRVGAGSRLVRSRFCRADEAAEPKRKWHCRGRRIGT